MSLAEYSSQYGLSISTLRRRIKGNQIKFKMINGKYFLPMHEYQEEVSSSVPIGKPFQTTAPNPVKEDNSFQTAKVLLDELKKAYMHSLQEKEQQIINLKQQVTDLKTLVMYLERANEQKDS